MPFAQLHYPFENAQRFEEHFPADLICEYVGQTRGWFYTLHVLATALFDRPAFSHCIAHGILLGNDGRKLSKRLKNFPDPEEFFASDGSDTMRWYLLSSPVLRGLDVAIEEAAMSEPLRVVLNPIWNSWHFLSLYGRSDGVVGRKRCDQTGLLDRYVLAKTRRFLEQVTEALDAYDLAGAAAAYSGFLDALTNWYIRRSRDRFWRSFSGDPLADADKVDAYDTLHTVLDVLARVSAPLLPFLAEEVFRGLTSARSVHLAAWPEPDELVTDSALVESMDLVREVCSAIHSVRKARGLRARLPLPKVTIAHHNASLLEPFLPLIADEVNVKAVELVTAADAFATRALSLVPAEIGPRLGPTTQQVIAAVRRGDWRPTQDGRVAVAGVLLEPGEFELRLVPRDPAAGRVIDDDRGVVLLATEVTPALEAEGTARDLVRIVQQARRDADLVISDRIQLSRSSFPTTSCLSSTSGARNSAARRSRLRSPWSGTTIRVTPTPGQTSLRRAAPTNFPTAATSRSTSSASGERRTRLAAIPVRPSGRPTTAAARRVGRLLAHGRAVVAGQRVEISPTRPPLP